MTTETSGVTFAGPYAELLGEMRELIDWLWESHDISFVKAGDDKVYAFGGGGYVVVMDESRWAGLVEFLTPNSVLTMKTDESGVVQVRGGEEDETSVRRTLRQGIDGIRHYYENRYWSTPKVSE
jgi:UDP-N-acetylenolpyruvoylglucosamine reductase